MALSLCMYVCMYDAVEGNHRATGKGDGIYVECSNDND
jgi:hypothetical protein